MSETKENIKCREALAHGDPKLNENRAQLERKIRQIMERDRAEVEAKVREAETEDFKKRGLPLTGLLFEGCVQYGTNYILSQRALRELNIRVAE